jgi:hypothetical protein
MKVTTETGQVIYVTWFQFMDLYSDALEGSPEMLSRLHRTNLERELKERREDSCPILVIDQGLAALPGYRCRARLVSHPLTSTGYYSELMVIWYASEIDGLPQLIFEMVNSISWADHAKNISFEEL